MSNEDFSLIHVHKSVKEAYDDLVTYHKYINKTTHVKDFLVETLIKAKQELKKEYQYAVGVHSALHSADITFNHHKIINRLTEKYDFEKWKDEDKIVNVFLLSDLDLIISSITKKRNERTITRIRKEILNLMGLIQIREGNKHLIGFPQYQIQDDKFKLQELNNNLIDNIISKISQNKEEGLGDIIIYRQLNNDKKLIDSFILKAKVNNIIKSGTKYYLKSIIEEQNKQEAETDLNNMFPLNQ